jgi:hypothetical protein
LLILEELDALSQFHKLTVFAFPWSGSVHGIDIYWVR